MFYTIKFRFLLKLCVGLLIAAGAAGLLYYGSTAQVMSQNKEFIKWVDFDVTYEAMKKALDMDVKSQKEDVKLDFTEMLAYLATKYGGDFKKYKSKDLDELKTQLTSGKTMEQLTEKMKHYGYYFEAFTAIFAEFVGEYEVEVPDETAPDGKRMEQKYGLKVFSPIAKNFPFTHYDDFGVGRSYGYKRKHLGNDLTGQVGTPIIAIEGGTVEALGWNMYGGWRIGIRSHDTKRYYYYAHLRKNFPYNKSLEVGSEVKAGDVIGYLGRTGYSNTENTNNIEIPHLHLGLQLIFDESQKEGNGEIWIDVYNIVRLLQANRSETVKDPETKEYSRIYQFNNGWTSKPEDQ